MSEKPHGRDGGAGAFSGARRTAIVPVQVNAIEITYIDPKSGNICRKDVFCDPHQWEWQWQARFLISSELVNLLSEAYASRVDRFKQLHTQLSTCRLGYLCDLWRLRRAMEGILASIPAKDIERCSLPKAGAVAPVHFFIPDHYLDAWTLEHLGKATHNCKEAMREEVRDLVTKLNVMDGGTWFQMLELILSKGHPLQAVAGGIMATCTEASERRNVENHVTGGLASKMEALKPVLDAFEAELEDSNRRNVQVEQSTRRKVHEIQELEKALREVRKKMRRSEIPRGATQEEEEEEVVEEAAKPDPVMEEKQLRDGFQRVCNAWAARSVEAQQEVERTQAAVAKWREKVVTCREEKLQIMEKEAGTLEQQAVVVKRQAKTESSRVQELCTKAQVIEEQLSQDDEGVEALVRRISELPPPNPVVFKFAQLQRELKLLQKHEVEIRQKMVLPQTRVRAIRHELRQLYKRLGWEWDLSDSDDDFNEKPYWERRKLAANGLTSFNNRLFLYAENSFHTRRLKKNAAKEKSQQEQTIVTQMAARRHQTGGGSARPRPAEGLGEAPEAVAPFQGDSEPAPRSRARRGWTATGRRPASSRDATSPEQLPVGASEPEWSGSDTAHMAELQLSFQSRLRQCTMSFIELLPQEGTLGEHRQMLVGVLQQLELLPADPAKWVDEAVGHQLDSICISLRNCVDEVASLGDHIHPICGALQHSVEFGSVRRQLAELQAHSELGTALGTPFQEFGAEATGFQHPPAPGTRRVLITDTWPDGGDGAQPRGSKPSTAVPVPPRPPPKPHRPDELGDTSWEAGRGKLRRRDLVRPEAVDFGFRPDGVGEESLENWSLFKVSKNGFANTGETTAGAPGSAAFRGSRSSTSLLGGSHSRSRLTESKAARFQKLASDCDFHEYMSQTQLGSQEMWRSNSTPELPLEKKRGPSLPQLVNKSHKARGEIPGNQNVRHRSFRSTSCQAAAVSGTTKR